MKRNEKNGLLRYGKPYVEIRKEWLQLNKKKLETICMWMDLANYYQGRIEEYQSISEDTANCPKVKGFAQKEIVHQQENLNDLFSLVRSQQGEKSFANVLILKYFEGYSLDEATETLGLNAATIKGYHADFTRYFKEQRTQIQYI